MIDELYQDIILDHGRHPRNFRKIEHPTHTAQGHNPLCGDRITVYLTMDNDRIADVAFEGRGCAISTAAASLLAAGLLSAALFPVGAQRLLSRGAEPVTANLKETG